MAESSAPARIGNPEKAVLLALAAGFVAFGVAFLLAPAKVAAVADLTTHGKNGLIELRAFYGGIELGLGLFFGVSALRPAWHVPALWAAFLTLGGVVGARIYGISVEGSAGAMIYVFLAVEIAGLCLAVFGLAKTQKKSEESKAAPSLVEKTQPIERTRVIEKTLHLEKKT
jgi:hypothetical protein